MTTGLVYQVRENLPVVVKELTMPGLVEWKKFLEEIKDIDMNKLQEKVEGARKKREVEKAQNTHLARLETLQIDAVEIMCLQLQCTNIDSNPMGQTRANTTFPTTTNQSALIHYTPRGASPNIRPSFCQRQPLTQEERETMRSHMEELTHHPDTPNRRIAYKEQMKQWFVKNGPDGRVNESTPFPLRPGSAMICSRECFKCGAHRHMAADC